jgi:hypothetical protein
MGVAAPFVTYSRCETRPFPAPEQAPPQRHTAIFPAGKFVLSAKAILMRRQPERGLRLLWVWHAPSAFSSASRYGGEMNIAGHGYGDLGDFLPAGSLPAIVERARLDKEWHDALARFGYRKVKHAYARQMRKSPKDEVFYGVEHLKRWPTMEFVRVWLKSEKKRMASKVRWTFVAAMLATIACALTFTAALSVFR